MFRIPSHDHALLSSFIPAARNMSIEDITTDIRRGKNNRRDFVVNADVVTTEKIYEKDLDSLIQDVSKPVCLITH